MTVATFVRVRSIHPDFGPVGRELDLEAGVAACLVHDKRAEYVTAAPAQQRELIPAAPPAAADTPAKRGYSRRDMQAQS